VPLNGHQSPNGNTLAGVFSMDNILSRGYYLIRRSDNEAQPQTIAEEALSGATERSVK